MNADVISYCDEPGYRVLDLQPDGVDCIPVLGFSDFLAVRRGADFHFHPGCMEFCLCLKGNLIFDTPDREYPFMPGSIFVSSPSEPHHLRNHPSGLKIYRVLFKIPKRGQCILGLDERGSEWVTRSITHLPKRLYAATPAVRTAFERMFDIYDNLNRRTPARRVKMRAATLDLLIALIDASRRLLANSSGKIKGIASRIHDNPAAEYPIEALACECGVSVTTFSNGFKRATGLPLHSYLLNCRIGKARELLVNTGKTVTAIGQQLGFYSTQQFARHFKRITGSNPQEFRKAAKNDLP